MPDTKISAGADPGTLVPTDKVPMARSASTTAYAATMAELAVFANTAYVPNYYAGTPSMDSTGAPGTAAFVSRGDHVHPSDTTRVAKAGDTMAGFLTLNANPTANLHAATKQYVDGSAPVGGPYVAIANMHDVGRNLLHNPLFNVAQRGAGPFTTTGSYPADRWILLTALDTVSAYPTPATDSNRSQAGDETVTQLIQLDYTGNAGAGSYTQLAQRIEGVRRLAGKTVTVSFWAAGFGASTHIGINGAQIYGTGGSPSASNGILATGLSVTITGTFTRYSVSFAIPSASGKTLGTNRDDYTVLQLFISSGATNNVPAGNIGVQSGTIQLWGVQLEIGSVATPLEKPDPRYDLANCQRFYQTGNYWLAGYGQATASVGYNQPLLVTMRAVPTLVVNTTTNSNVTGATVSTNGNSAVIPYATATASAGILMTGSFTASADL